MCNLRGGNPWHRQRMKRDFVKRVVLKYSEAQGMKVIFEKEKDIPIEKTDLEEYDLYQVHSVVNNFIYRGIYYNNLKINWFVINRKEPVVPFERAIENYSELPFAARVNPENFIKQCFTLAETESLEQYLASTQKMPITGQRSCQWISRRTSTTRYGLCHPA